jgi:tRNA threonylcarbamoyladenosine biosynthesis protein TsaE
MLPLGLFVTQSAQETFDLACRLGEMITEPTVLLLSGDLGAGKTVFTKGIAAGLDIDPAEVNSPTFTLVNAHEGRLRLYHLDLYRLAGEWEEIYALGLDEMLNEDNAVVLIEWAERLGAFQIPNATRVQIVEAGEDARRIVMTEFSTGDNS